MVKTWDGKDFIVYKRNHLAIKAGSSDITLVGLNPINRRE